MPSATPWPRSRKRTDTCERGRSHAAAFLPVGHERVAGARHRLACRTARPRGPFAPIVGPAGDSYPWLDRTILQRDSPGSGRWDAAGRCLRARTSAGSVPRTEAASAHMGVSEPARLTGNCGLWRSFGPHPVPDVSRPSDLVSCKPWDTRGSGGRARPGRNEAVPSGRHVGDESRGEVAPAAALANRDRDGRGSDRRHCGRGSPW